MAARLSLSAMDVGLRRYNEKPRDYFMNYPNYYRHSFFPNAVPTPNFFEQYYMPGNKCNSFVNQFNQVPCIFNESYPKHIKQRFIGKPEIKQDTTKVDKSNGDVMSTMTGVKDKTPMCLVNELSRFNKIEQKYILTNEEGPAHKKVFFVSLKLGEETFSSSGQSIRKARHAAAVEALKSTKYHMPPNKSNSYVNASKEVNASLTPTVELNSLAMKRGESVLYDVVGGFKSKKPTSQGVSLHSLRCQNPAFIVKVCVGGKEFFGEGYSVKSARHSAAGKALNGLRSGNLGQSSESGSKVSEETATSSSSAESKATNSRSEISQVQEIAFKRGWSATFQITGETGPAHMRMYLTTCTCGTLAVTGEGNSKKTSKRRSAEKMLEELNKLSPLPSPTLNKPPNKLRTRNDQPKQNNRMLLKAGPDYGMGINPVSRLIQIQQAKKQPEPSFSLLEERGKSRDKEFHVQVTVAGKSCSSWALSKKLAKRNAAEKMLSLLGYSNQMKPNNSDKKVTFSELIPEVNEGEADTKSHHLGSGLTSS